MYVGDEVWVRQTGAVGQEPVKGTVTKADVGWPVWVRVEVNGYTLETPYLSGELSYVESDPSVRAARRREREVTGYQRQNNAAPLSDDVGLPELFDQPAALPDCGCGRPSVANFHTSVVYTLDGETSSTDVYTCGEHTPDLGSTGQPASDLPGLAAAWELLAWDGKDRAEVLEYTTTELR